MLTNFSPSNDKNPQQNLTRSSDFRNVPTVQWNAVERLKYMDDGI